jgi:hypothetical protein
VRYQAVFAGYPSSPSGLRWFTVVLLRLVLVRARVRFRRVIATFPVATQAAKNYPQDRRFP